MPTRLKAALAASLLTLGLFAVVLMTAFPASAQGSLVRIAGVTVTGRDTPIRGSGAALAVRPLEVTVLTTISGANATVTLTLPGVAGQFHYLTRLHAFRTCTTAITGTAVLAYTSTNLPGSFAFSGGNACAVGSNNVDLEMVLSHPLKSSVAGTDTTIVAPAAGAAGIIRVTATYYTAE